MNRLQKIFSSRWANIFCFLFAIINRVIFTNLYSLIGVDTKFQLTYAENLMAGKGLGATKYFTTDLNTPVFDTQQLFPPGFSFTIIPFLKLFDGNEYKSILAYDIVVAVLFIIAVRVLGKKAGLSSGLNNVVTIIAGCSQYFFFMSWSSTDAISVCLLLFSVAITISIISKKKDISIGNAIGFGFLFCSTFFFRYMYLPIAFLLPSLIQLAGVFLKNKGLRSAGLKTLIVSVSFLAFYFLISRSLSGNALYVTNVGRGIFIDQLAECYPFLPASFINVDFGAQLVQRISGMNYTRVIFCLKIANLLMLVLLLFFFGRFIIKQKKAFSFSNHFLFIAIGSFVSIMILGLLAWLTLTYKELSWGFYHWTQVQDPRYFSFLYVFVPLVLFVCLHHYRYLFKGLLLRVFVIFLLICLSTEVIHGVYYNMKILVAHKDLAFIRDADKGFRNFPSVINEVKSQYPERELLVCSPDKFYLLAATKLGYKSVFDYDNFLQTGIRVRNKSILLMPIQSQDVIIIDDYIKKKRPRLITTIAGTSFYAEEIDPQ